MPLESGSSKAAISNNVATERRAGKPEAQACAIAYRKARGDMDGSQFEELKSLLDEFFSEEAKETEHRGDASPFLDSTRLDAVLAKADAIVAKADAIPAGSWTIDKRYPGGIILWAGMGRDGGDFYVECKPSSRENSRFTSRAPAEKLAARLSEEYA